MSFEKININKYRKFEKLKEEYIGDAKKNILNIIKEIKNEGIVTKIY